jgi:uncharacterized low-complexity protein
VKAPVLQILVVLALVGCRRSEPLAGEQMPSGEPALAVAPAGEGKATVETTPQGGLAEGKAAEGKATDGKATEGKTTEGKTTAGEAADGTPTQSTVTDEPADPVPPVTAPAGIEPFFASDDDEAVAEARYTARKPPKRGGEIRGLLDVRPLLGQPVLASPKPDADVIATIAPAGLVTPTDSCMWVIYQDEIKWTKGKIRCGDVFLREPDSGEGHEEMVPVLETVTAKGIRYSRIIATNAGRTGWVKTESVPQRFSKVLARYAAGGSRTWDRMIYSEPGVSPVKIEFRGAVALKIAETRTVDGRIWLRVVARVDQCLEESNRKLGEGWLPQHAEDGALNVYYELSC